MKKDSFVLYTKINEVVRELSDEQKGRLFQAILDYEETGEVPELDHFTKLAFIPIRQDLDINNEKWEKEKKARSEAGKKGMAIRYGKTAETSAETKGTAQQEPEKEKPTQPQEEKPKKKRKTKAEKEAEAKAGKTRCADFVWMTKEEHQKLIDKYGEDKTARQIEVLNNYKGSNGKTYASDYLAILNWVADRVDEEWNRRGGNNGSNNTGSKSSGSSGTPPGRNFEPSKGFGNHGDTDGGDQPGDQDAADTARGGNV